MGILSFIRNRNGNKEFRDAFREKNQHNEATAKSTFDIDRVSVGNGTYGALSVMMYNSTAKLKIGHYCSIAPDVLFVLAAEHETEMFSTYPFAEKFGVGGGEPL